MNYLKKCCRNYDNINCENTYTAGKSNNNPFKLQLPSIGMQVISCPKCKMPIESSNYYLKGVAIRCRHCNYSALPITSGVDITGRAEVAQNDLFTKELAYESILKKLTLLFLFLVVSATWFTQHVAIIFLFASGFFVFGIAYFVIRMKNKQNSEKIENEKKY